MSKLQLFHGCCLDKLPAIPDQSVDSVVTDPPYELGFMGKKWDSSGIAYNVQVWRECLRVLKPGGHLLAFGGSRTYHRLACAIEDAGFEIRDCIMWVYGSGFPKSLDVSKAIDKAAGRIGQSVIALKKHLIELADASGMTRSTIDAACGFRATNYLTLPADGKRPDPWVNCLPPRDKWAIMKRVLGADDSLDDVFTHAEREVVGTKKAAPGVAFGSEGPTELEVTAPATDAARQWQGWGTALKPAHEPVVVARKPLIGTVAANVLTHGTGALNIDGCRVGSEVVKSHHTAMLAHGGQNARPWHEGHQATTHENTGRWPANLIHDGSEEVVELFPGTNGSSASRFFYTAKTPKSERQGSKHPTIKPLSLIRYLCRLVTPPGGTVLDPFLGSGTTAVAALLEGLSAIGIEKEEEYLRDARSRVKRRDSLDK